MLGSNSIGSLQNSLSQVVCREVREECVVICKRCKGSGSLFRRKDAHGRVLPIRDSFRTCTDCGGKGTDEEVLGPNTIRIHTLKRKASRRERKFPAAVSCALSRVFGCTLRALVSHLSPRPDFHDRW